MPAFPCNIDKVPLTKNGFKDATTDPKEFKKLIPKFTSYLLGVPTGNLSGLDVLDIDQQGLNWLSSIRNEIPTTRSHKTRSGGSHIIFNHIEGLCCSVSKIATGVDVRADGGYIIWWPAANLPVENPNIISDWPATILDRLRIPEIGSISMATPNTTRGKSKKWLNWKECQELLTPSEHDDAIIEELYLTILHSALSGSGVAINQDYSVSKFSRESKFTVQAAAQSFIEISKAMPGARNDCLNKKSYALGRLMARSWTNPRSLIRALWRGAVECGLVKDDGVDTTIRTIESGLLAGLKDPYRDLDQRRG